MRKVLKWFGLVLGVALLLLVAGFAYASWKSEQLVSRTMEAHEVELPLPYPEANLEADAGLPMDGGSLQASAPSADQELARAVARGKHLVFARYVCVECHGKDFSGGVMVDDPALGTMMGPNLTSGKGGVVANYTMADWDRIVRHGIKKSGNPGAMPSEDFLRMSDQELSDIVAYIRSVPPVDNVVPAVQLGPLGKVLIALGKFPLAADMVEDHHAAHTKYPPTTEPTAVFGEHLAAVCTGCHRKNFEGGPMVFGDPSWVPAANLTSHEDGLKGWSYDDFTKAVRELKRPDGSEVRFPMSLMQPYAKAMTEVELQALWAYLQSVEPVPTGT